MSENNKKHLISAARVFVASFLGVVATSIGTVGLEKSAIIALLIAAISAALKAAMQAYLE